MKNELMDIVKQMLNGKWGYQGSTTNFNKTQNLVFEGKYKKDMPEYLFFGEHVGTDLKKCFSYTSYSLKINDISYKYFFINYFDTLVLYEHNNDNNKKRINWNIYERKITQKTYSEEDILTLQKKYDIKNDVTNFPFNEKLIGTWQMIDYIYESEIKGYNGKIKTEDAMYALSPMFDKLEIIDENTVYILGKNEDDVIELTFESGIRTFVRDNSIMKINMDKTSNDNNNFIILNHLNNQKHKGIYKRINGQEYLFVNLNNFPDVDEEIFVYKKV